jgi:hypothetical protein
MTHVQGIRPAIAAMIGQIRSLASMRTLLKALVSGVLCWVSCAAGALDPAISRISEADGFVDIDLPIAEVTEDSGLVRIVARGDVAGTMVGLEVDFHSGPGHSGSRLSLPLGAARIRSIGAASDSFVRLLASRYRLPSLAKTMVPAVDASVVGLEGDPAHVLDRVTKMKFFFFDSGPEDRYAEVFINVDVNKRVLEFHEKDEDYRKPLLLALT